MRSVEIAGISRAAVKGQQPGDDGDQYESAAHCMTPVRHVKERSAPRVPGTPRTRYPLSSAQRLAEQPPRAVEPDIVPAGFPDDLAGVPVPHEPAYVHD